MPENTNHLPKRLHAGLERRVDEFDAAWNSGSPPPIQQFLPDSLRTPTIPTRAQWRKYVAELLMVDLEYRIRGTGGGPRPCIEDYYEGVPWLPQDEPVLLEVISTEYLMRRQQGDGTDVGEYLQRFPQLGATLARCLGDADREFVREQSPSGGNDNETESYHAFEATVKDTVRCASANDTALTAPKDDLPRRFGDYVLQREIARGGMGIVYQALQHSLNRTVAVKVILTGQLAEEEDVRRFRTEAEAAARLDHPHIVPIYEIGAAEGQHYFSMAYVEGESLARQIPLEPQDAARVVRDVAGAIHCAHENGIIHRDIKPSNILLEKDGTPRVTDFGLARLINVDSELTIKGLPLGTVPYMSREQALGEVDRVDPRSDIYSLGATLYCLLIGRPPFEAANQTTTLLQVINDDAVPPRQQNSAIPRDLENICLKCLHKSPRDRYQTAAELREDLDRFLNGKPTVARPLSTLERLARFCRRRPGTAAVIAGIVSGLMILNIWVQKSNRDLRLANDKIEVTNEKLQESNGQLAESKQKLEQTNQAVTVQENETRRANTKLQQANLDLQNETSKTQRALRRAEFNIYLNALQRIQQWWVAGQMEEVRNELNGLRGNLQFWNELHGWEADHLGGRLRQLRPPINAHDQAIHAVAWSPDGRWWASAGQDTLIKVWDAATGRLHVTFSDHADWVRNIGFVGDGSQLLSLSDDGTARLWNVEKGVPVDTIATDIENPQVSAISEDGRRWAWSKGNGEVHIYDLTSRRQLPALPTRPEGQITALAFDPAGEQIAIADATSRTIVMRSIVGTAEAFAPFVVRHEKGAVYAMDFSPDGDRLAAGGANGWVQVWETSTGKPGGGWPAHQASSIYGVRFAGNPRQLFTCSEDRTVCLWDIDREVLLERFRGHTGAVYSVQIQPQGEDVLSAGDDGTLRLWQPGHDRLELTGISETSLVLPHADGSGLRYLTDDSVRQVTFASPEQAVGVPFAAADRARAALALAQPPGAFAIATEGDVVLYDAAGVETQRWADFPRDVDRLGAAPDASRLAAADVAGLVKMFDVRTKEIAWERQLGDRVAAWEYSGGGRQLVAVDIRGDVVVMDAASGETLHKATWLYGPKSMDCCPRAAMVAVGGSDGQIHLYRPDDLSELSGLRGHQGDVRAVAFSPDGQRLASGGFDGTVRIWAPQVRSWASEETWSSEQDVLLLTLEGHQRAVSHVFWVDDGRSLVSVDRGGTAIRWRGRVP